MRGVRLRRPILQKDQAGLAIGGHAHVDEAAHPEPPGLGEGDHADPQTVRACQGPSFCGDPTRMGHVGRGGLQPSGEVHALADAEAFGKAAIQLASGARDAKRGLGLLTLGGRAVEAQQAPVADRDALADRTPELG